MKQGKEAVDKIQALRSFAGKHGIKGSVLNAATQAAVALEMRKKGATYAQIGETLGLNENTVFHLVQKALRKVNAELLEGVEEVRRLELDRLDELLAKGFELLESAPLLAIDRILKIMERRTQYLGLDAPKELRTGRLPDNPLVAELQKRALNDPRIRQLLADIVTDEGESSELSKDSQRRLLEGAAASKAALPSFGGGLHGAAPEAHRVHATEAREE